MSTTTGNRPTPERWAWPRRALGSVLPCFVLLAASLLPVRGAQADLPLREGTQRLDGLAAVVGGVTPGPRVITVLRSDVELRARLWLVRETTLDRALGPLPEGLLNASLTELIGEALIAVEADRLSLSRPAAATIAEERARLLGRGELARVTAELLQALGVSEREIGVWAERRAVVSGFLAANLEGTLDVAPAELERLFRSEENPFQGQPFEEVRARYAAWLTQQRTQQAVARWVQSLAGRIPHRVLARD